MSEPRMLSEILSDAGIATRAGADVSVHGISYDSRLIKRGDLFFAIPGARSDGHAFLADWILGSPNVEFSDYSIDRGPLVRQTTDHPVVSTKVTIDAVNFKNAY